MNKSEMPPRSVAFKTLGCKLNQAETESMATAFRQLGWQIVEFGQTADAIIVNSCTVTNSADRKSRHATSQSLRISGDRENSLVVLTGCYADGHREQLEAEGRAYVVGNKAKSHIPGMVDAHFRGEIIHSQREEENDPFGYPLADSIFRTRAMVKIQDGCDNFCSFCIIPFVRGSAVSRPPDQVVNAVSEAASKGFREIILTGVNMSRWSHAGLRFHDLLAAVLDIPGSFRVRLGSIEPERMDKEFLHLLHHPKMTPHLHLCLQSGSDKILLAMRRQYNSADFRHTVEKVRSVNPLFNFTTDVIAGYPQEGPDEFRQTLDFCREMAFGHIHTFPYSRREGTRADRLINRQPDVAIPPAELKSRCEQIRLLSEESKRCYRKSLIGTNQEVIIEKSSDGFRKSILCQGMSAPYVPVRFTLPSARRSSSLANTLVSLHIHGIGEGEDPCLLGEVCDIFPAS